LLTALDWASAIGPCPTCKNAIDVAIGGKADIDRARPTGN